MVDAAKATEMANKIHDIVTGYRGPDVYTALGASIVAVHSSWLKADKADAKKHLHILLHGIVHGCSGGQPDPLISRIAASLIGNDDTEIVSSLAIVLAGILSQIDAISPIKADAFRKVAIKTINDYTEL